MVYGLKIVIMLLSLSVLSLNAKEFDKTEPYAMMKLVSEETFSRLKEEKAEIQANPNLLKGIVEEELMPYVNEKYAAYKLLGSNLRNTTADERAEFVTAFRRYLISSYAQILTLYTNEEIKPENKKPIPSDKKVISIRVDIISPTRPVVHIDFSLRKNKKTGEWQVFDMVAEGVSFLSAKQSEWSGKIRKDGVSEVSQVLLDLADNPIILEGN